MEGWVFLSVIRSSLLLIKSSSLQVLRTFPAPRMKQGTREGGTRGCPRQPFHPWEGIRGPSASSWAQGTTHPHVICVYVRKGGYQIFLFLFLFFFLMSVSFYFCSNFYYFYYFYFHSFYFYSFYSYTYIYLSLYIYFYVYFCVSLAGGFHAPGYLRRIEVTDRCSLCILMPC